MLKTIDNCIYHTRGDTGTVAFAPTVDGVLIEKYTATFTAKKTFDDDVPVLQKTVDAGMVTFEHDDTNKLAYGTYVYDIEVQYTDAYGKAQVKTFGPYNYYVMPDVTR
jgi:hypothetical protein